jgi:hypothetical protein
MERMISRASIVRPQKSGFIGHLVFGYFEGGTWRVAGDKEISLTTDEQRWTRIEQ